MSKENDEKVVKEIIEYANNEIKKSKKKFATILISVIAGVALIATAVFFAFAFEMPVPYTEGMIEAEIPVDEGLDISINLPNYKNAKAILVNVDDNSYDLYLCVKQTLATKIWGDSDNANNLLRVGNGIVVDYQSESICGYLPNGSNAENIANVYYVDNLSKDMMIMDDAELIEYENKVLVWTRQ